MKAWDLPISKNPLESREDLVLSLDQLMEPLLGRFVRANTGLHLGNSSALYDDRVSLMEGLSRLLWGLAPFAAGTRKNGGRIGRSAVGASAKAIPLVRDGLIAGTDPAHPYFWGVGGDRDQRYVEMAAIALSLLIAREEFWDPLPAEAKKNLSAWLGRINSVELPPTNWEFFRILVNAALRSLDLPFSPARMEEGLVKVDALYRSDGWYADETNFDLYNPFAFHFFGLVYAKLFGDVDRARAGRFRERASLFSRQYLPWFSPDGGAVPFGRSLCYRFAAAAFFSACAFAGEDTLSPGVLKGLVLRNLRWWLKRPIFDHEGALTIGYAYPNLIMAEQYNSPGSPYWALKTYLPLALDAGHPFWASEELPLPGLPEVSLNAEPGLIACRPARPGPGSREPGHVYFLNSGQYPCWESVNAAAKYAKFAYSSRFGFCVSRSSFHLPKTGCDSSLLFSEGDGYWRERRSSHDRFACLDYAFSAWEPWPDLRVRTWLIPCGHWHVRIHAIESGRSFDCAEGGFSLPRAQGFEGSYEASIDSPEPGSLYAEYPWAAGGIVDFGRGNAARTPELHSSEPDLNVLHPRVQIPILNGKIEPGSSVLSCAVFAFAIDGADGAEASRQSWKARPRLEVDPEGARAVIRHGNREIRIDMGKRS